MAESLSLVVETRLDLTSDITEFTLTSAIGELPPFEAGAHLTVHTPSLSNDDIECGRYVIAVKREENGRGGSLAMYQELQVGQIIHWPCSQVHSKDFSGVATLDGEAVPFKIRCATTDEVFEVPANKSIHDVLRDNGIRFKSSRESGT